jgi:L-rhamnose 1-dehydrogenase
LFLTHPRIGPELLTTTVGTNLTGAFFAIQSAARHMCASGAGGSIIAVSSVSALVGGSRQAHYTPTKAGLLSLMQSCACALGRHGVRCNALLPGTVLTRLNEEDMREGGEKRAYMEGRIPLGRLGEPADVAGPAVFLASDLSRYVVSLVSCLAVWHDLTFLQTGAQLLVDGGLFVNLQ